MSAAGPMPGRRKVARAGRSHEPHEPLSKIVADKLRRAILTGRYKPEERLVEDRISAELGVSRVPVREALKALAGEGIVDLRPRRGAWVTAISADVARDLIEVRATLEGMNARLAARHRETGIVAQLREVLVRGNAAAGKGVTEKLAGLNGEFHDLLARAGSNRVLFDIMRSLRDRTNLVFAANRAERAREDWKEHAAILSAVIAGDAEMAELLATRHVLNAAAARLR